MNCRRRGFYVSKIDGGLQQTKIHTFLISKAIWQHFDVIVHLIYVEQTATFYHHDDNHKPA